MILIVGLGNPGKKYEKTRHNLGFMVVDELARKWTQGEVKWEEKKKFNSTIHFPLSDILLVKPQTFMNNSGMAVVSLANFYKVGGEDLWVIHDDLDIPLGHLKITEGKGTAGHHGVASIVTALGSADFVRFRLGIGGEHVNNPEKFVLESFLPTESDEIRHLLKQTLLAVKVALDDGVEKAMTEYNR